MSREQKRVATIKKNVGEMLSSAIRYMLIFLFILACNYSVSAQIIEQSDTTKVTPSDTTQNKQKLEKFREAFDKLMDQEKNKNPELSKSDQDPALELEGFVLDETRSKMGRDFYALFYQKWQAPEDASNFTLTITEKPTFGRGSQITIKLDYQEIFSARLQPKYEYIDALSEQAVGRCKRVIKEQASVKQQLMGY